MQLLVPLVWLWPHLTPFWRPGAWVLACLVLAAHSHRHPSRDTEQLQPDAFAELARLQPRPNERYVFFTVKFPTASMYDESARVNPNTRQLLLPLGYISLTPPQQHALTAALGGPYRVETLAQSHVHVVAEPATIAQLMAYLQAKYPGRYTLQTHRQMGKYRHCQILQAQP